MKPTRQYVTVVAEKRIDTRQMSYVVKWTPRRGDPRRRRFQDLALAEAEADHIEKLFANGMRLVADLSLEMLSGVALLLAQIPDVPVHEVVQFYLEAHGRNGGAPPVTIEKAGEAFIATRSGRDGYSARQVQSVRQHIRRFMAAFPNRLLTTFGTKELNVYIETEIGGAPKTRSNHVTTLRSFGAWARTEQKWFPRGIPSPFEEMKKPPKTASDKEIYSPEEITRLLAATPLRMLGFIATGAFSGMRAAERLRLEGKHWQTDNDQFELGRDITKTKRRRLIGSLPNLVEWMKVLNPGDGPIVQFRGNIYDETPKIAKAAGVPWKFNALRTSFASYHLQHFKNPPLTSMLDGHTVDMLETDYKTLRGVNDGTAKAYFEVTPQSVVEYARANKLPDPDWTNRI